MRLLFVFLFLAVEMPVQLLERSVADLRIGESGWITAEAVLVEEDRSTYVNTQCALVSPAHKTVKVTRLKDGYSLLIPDVGLRWRPRSLNHASDYSSFAPVVKIELGEERTVADLVIGETTWIASSSILADEDRNAYVVTTSGIGLLMNLPNTLKVTRTRDGYMLSIPKDKNLQWVPGKITEKSAVRVKQIIFQ